MSGVLNFHRPCGFATVTVDEKGRRRKKYKTYQTPYERLRSLEDAETYLRPGVSFKGLDAIAARHTDNEAAALMQTARDRLFKKFYSRRSLTVQFPPVVTVQSEHFCSIRA